MSRYYQDSKPFVWLRKQLKIDKPYALPWGGWEEWDKELKATRPVAYFLTETLPDWLEKPAEWLIDPLHSAHYYFRNRFVDKTHYLRTDLEPGKWHEFETCMLHGCFTEMVDFIEVEMAWHHVCWASEEERQKYHVPFWRRHRLLRFKRWRNPQAGIDHLKWEMTLEEPTHQRERAFELMFLYTWWKKRANRKDEWEETGLRAFWDSMDTKYGDEWLGLGKKSLMTSAERQEYDRLSDAVRKMEEDRHQEDDDMLIRLVKLRRTMWT